jgi:vacuolar-type H+-ATPase catalytic subunit A/Vma1
LPGEVIRLEGERARIEVCAGTAGPRVGERVRETGRPLEVEFGRALLGSDKTVLQQALANWRTPTSSYLTVRAPRIPHRLRMGW